MDKLQDHLKRFFAITDTWQRRLSEHWRTHTNRRTILISIVLGAIALLLYEFVIQPPDNFPIDTLVTVPSGASTNEVASILQTDGVVRSAFAFKLLVEAMGSQHGVRAGDYMFKQPVDIFTVAHALVAGHFGLEPAKIRIPEGATIKLMADVYAGQLQRFDPQQFIAAATPIDGTLFPDTYFFLPNATANTVVETMHQNFETHLNATSTLSTSTLAQLIAKSGHSLSDVVIMASLIEREAPDMHDRRIIAGILWHRIKRGMPLQTDVPLTALTGKSDAQLTVADLATSSPYNTYTHKGLPPGPIGNPSFESLEAAADPIETNYLYFMADKQGVTHYARTYAEHLANERRYLGR